MVLLISNRQMSHVVQRPEARLRHLQLVWLRSFAPEQPVGRQDFLFYELYRRLENGSDELVYTSEKVCAVATMVLQSHRWRIGGS